jgi:hypothetical protein
MPNPKQPGKPRSTDDILREMENMSKGVEPDSEPQRSPAPARESHGGALKSLLNFFVTVVPEEEMSASKSSAPPAKNNPPPPARVRVADLVAEEPPPSFSAPETHAGVAADKPFDEIYKEAGIADSPCSVDELTRLLENPAVANQPMSVKIIAVNLTLSAKGVGPDVPIADAVRRDRALDAYQQMLNRHAGATEHRNKAKIQQLTQEVEEYLKRKQAEMETLKTQIAEAQRQAADFAVRREAEEKRLAGVIGPFLEGKPNPVSVGGQPDQASPNE